MIEQERMLARRLETDKGSVTPSPASVENRACLHKRRGNHCESGRFPCSPPKEVFLFCHVFYDLLIPFRAIKLLENIKRLHSARSRSPRFLSIHAFRRTFLVLTMGIPKIEIFFPSLLANPSKEKNRFPFIFCWQCLKEWPILTP